MSVPVPGGEEGLPQLLLAHGQPQAEVDHVGQQLGLDLGLLLLVDRGGSPLSSLAARLDLGLDGLEVDLLDFVALWEGLGLGLGEEGEVGVLVPGGTPPSAEGVDVASALHLAGEKDIDFVRNRKGCVEKGFGAARDFFASNSGGRIHFMTDPVSLISRNKEPRKKGMNAKVEKIVSGVSKGRLCPLGTRGSILRKIMPVSTFLFSLFWCKFDLGMKMCKAPFLRDDQLSPIFCTGPILYPPAFGLR